MILSDISPTDKILSLSSRVFKLLQPPYELHRTCGNRYCVHRMFHGRVSDDFDFNAVEFIMSDVTEADIAIPLQFVRRGIRLRFKVTYDDRKDGCGVTRVLENHCDFVKVTPGCIDLIIDSKRVSIKPNAQLELMIQEDLLGYFEITLPLEN